MIHYYLESDGKRAVLRDLDFYKKAGISEKELEIYAEMERNFQKYMEGGHVLFGKCMMRFHLAR